MSNPLRPPIRFDPQGYPLWAESSEQLTDLNAVHYGYNEQQPLEWDSMLSPCRVELVTGWRFGRVADPFHESATTLCTIYADSPDQYSFLVMWTPARHESVQFYNDEYITWFGVTHLCGNVFHAQGWMPFAETSVEPIWREKGNV